jgi:hypothetical protein
VEAGKRWGEVAVAIRIARNSASTHMVNRLREVYREYLEKYAQAVEQVCRLTCLLCCQSPYPSTKWFLQHRLFRSSSGTDMRGVRLWVGVHRG